MGFFGCLNALASPRLLAVGKAEVVLVTVFYSWNCLSVTFSGRWLWLGRWTVAAAISVPEAAPHSLSSASEASERKSALYPTAFHTENPPRERRIRVSFLRDQFLCCLYRMLGFGNKQVG